MFKNGFCHWGTTTVNVSTEKSLTSHEKLFDAYILPKQTKATDIFLSTVLDVAVILSL